MEIKHLTKEDFEKWLYGETFGEWLVRTSEVNPINKKQTNKLTKKDDLSDTQHRTGI